MQLSVLFARRTPRLIGRLLLPFLLGLSLLLFVACKERKPEPKSSGEAGTEAATDEAEAAQEAPMGEPRPLTLWKVSKEGQEDSYLFGTCHTGIPLDGGLSPEGIELIKTSSRFVMEMDIEEVMKDPQKLISGLMLADDGTLNDLLGEEDWAALVDTFKLGPAAEPMSKMHPFATLGFIVDQVSSHLFTLTTGQPMDLQAAEIATESERARGYLETLDEQLALFLNMPMEEMLDGLRELLTEEGRSELREQLTTVLDVCRTGDISGAGAILAELERAGWEEALLTNRNKNWAPKLDLWFAEGSTFVAAGAAHMMGESSVIALLEERGYSIEQMTGSTRVIDRKPASEAEAAEMQGLQIPREVFIEQAVVHGAPALCGEGGPVLQCYSIDTAECTERFAAALSACAVQLELPEVLNMEDLEQYGNKVGTCAAEMVSAAVADRATGGEGCPEASAEE